MVKQIIFNSIKFLPLAGILLLATYFLIHFYDLKNQSEAEIYHNINQFYEPSWWERPAIVQILPQITNSTIVALGESSLIIPGTCDFKNRSDQVFTVGIEKLIKPLGLSMLNLGFCGDDTKAIINSLKLILSKKRPAAFLFYFGHNDYGRGNREAVLSSRRFFSKTFLDWLFAPLSAESRFKADYFVKNAMEPTLVDIYRLLDPDLFRGAEHRRYMQNITMHFKQNLKTLIAMCRNYQVPMIFFTPMGNLLYPPLGAEPLIKDKYRNAFRNKDVPGLLEVSENDFFGYDQRAKLDGIEAIRELGSHDILIVDTFKTLIARNNVKDFQMFFSDIFHLSPSGHQFVLEEFKKSDYSNFLIKNTRVKKF